MRLRDLEERDMPALREMHKQSGFDYPLPKFRDFKCGSFERVLVFVDENDYPVQVLAAKKTVEMYLLMDKQWRNPRWRLEAFMQAHEDMRQELMRRGYVDCNAWLPPEVEKSFGRRLERLFGWTRSRWRSYSRKLKD